VVAVVAVDEGVGVGGVGPVGAVTHKKLVVEKAYQIVLGAEIIKSLNKLLNREMVGICFFHPIFLSFGFWYFGHFSCMIFFPDFSVLPTLPCKI
jgi:hypothetical protein